MKYHIYIDDFNNNECSISVLSTNELQLSVTRDILDKIEKHPENKWYAGYFLCHNSEFEPLPCIDVIKFMEYVSQARDEIEKELEYRKQHNKNYLISEINRLTSQLNSINNNIE